LAILAIILAILAVSLVAGFFSLVSCGSIVQELSSALHLGALPGRHSQVEEGNETGTPLQPPVRQHRQAARKDELVRIVSSLSYSK
jgi:hypothetical protein